MDIRNNGWNESNLKILFIFLSSLLFSTLCWLISVIIFISNRVKNHQAKSLSIQSDWEEFDGDSKTEFTALPDPKEFELDIPL